MRVRHRVSILAVIGLAMLAAFVIWIRHPPEPKYQGIRFGVFLDEFWKNREMRRTAREAVKEMGSSVVPYLVSQIENDPVREFLFRIKPSMPDKVASIFPDQTKYANRRSMAAALLIEAGTNAVSALPRLLAATEAEHPDYTHNYIRAVGMIAPGTEYEDRARRVMQNAISGMQHGRDRETRRMAYYFLGGIGGNEAVPTLIGGLKELGMADTCIESLLQIGTNAVPELKKVAAQESGHVRPASLALEKIEQKFATNK